MVSVWWLREENEWYIGGLYEWVLVFDDVVGREGRYYVLKY